MAFLDAYVEQQKELGRFPRPLKNRLSDVMEWMENQEVVDEDARVMLGSVTVVPGRVPAQYYWLVIGQIPGQVRRYLLAQGTGRLTFQPVSAAHDRIRLDRAGRWDCGLGLAWLGLRGIEMLFGDFVENLVGLDWVMVLTAIGLAIVSALLAGLYPTWRACRIAPASQLKAH